MRFKGHGVGLQLAPGNAANSFSWSQYWTNMISAVVENAAPTHIVLTWATGKNIIASDLSCTVNGSSVAVSSASWAGGILTVVLASAIIYGDVVIITFVKTGQTKSITNNVALDTNAAAFLTAAGITSDETQKKALNRLVVDLKAINGTLASFVDFDTPANSIVRALYPMIGGSAAAHKYNLIDPRDADAAFRIAFNGAVTHDATGVRFAGATSSWGDTKFNPSTMFSSADSNGIDLFCNSDYRRADSQILMGCKNSTAYALGNSFGAGCAFIRGKTYFANSERVDCIRTGFVQLNMSGTAVGQFKMLGDLNTLCSNSDTITGNMPNANIGLGKLNGDTYYSDDYISFAAIRNASISDAANVLYRAAVIRYQQALSRCPAKCLFIDGHSMMRGTATYRTFKYAYDGVNESFANRTLTYFAQSVASSTIADIVSRYSVLTGKKRNTELKNILVVWIGINELGPQGKTGAATWSELKSYIDQALTDGFKVVALTATKTNMYSIETERVAFNTALKAYNPGNFYYVDLDTHAEFSDPNNTTYFNADKLHMTDAGYTIVAADIVAKVNSL